MTITSQDALDSNTSIASLAQEWAENLNDNLQKPTLIVDVVQRLEGTSRILIRDAIDGLPSLMGAIILFWVRRFPRKNLPIFFIIPPLCFGGLGGIIQVYLLLEIT